jgi:hypothetical protein
METSLYVAAYNHPLSAEAAYSTWDDFDDSDLGPCVAERWRSRSIRAPTPGIPARFPQTAYLQAKPRRRMNTGDERTVRVQIRGVLTPRCARS